MSPIWIWDVAGQRDIEMEFRTYMEKWYGVYPEDYSYPPGRREEIWGANRTGLDWFFL